jgi:hypothetical protein
MARYKAYDYDQLLMVPVSLEEQLVPGTLEYAIHHVVEERLDLSLFDERYRNDETGRSAVDPKVLLKRKIDTEEGRRMYSRRLGIVEPVFANIRAQKRMDRFTLRGRAKVNIQWMLYCLVHNIGKIVNFGESYAMAV